MFGTRKCPPAVELPGPYQVTLAAAAPGPNRYQLGSLTGKEANVDDMTLAAYLSHS
jgi:hypothetical protein